ncbi:rab5 GDP/GTP exchange factor-like [Centruroides vittatus]|uniref:rab5 GDP/GTP exchange factor-like n=1 Tax=Centruroides vittatus TaxID=120091 RepID=UPI00350EC1B1
MFRNSFVTCTSNTLLPFPFKIQPDFDIEADRTKRKTSSSMINTKVNPLDLQKRIELLKKEEKITEQFHKLSKEYKLSRRVKNDVKKLLQHFLEKLAESETNTLNGLSHMVLSFYKTTEEHMANNPVYKSLSYEDKWKILHMIEKYLTARLNKVIFQCITFEESENDAGIQKRIHDHYWITPKHLDSKVNLEGKVVRDILDSAVSDLNEMNFKSSTLDKIDCVVECSRKIYDIMKTCSQVEGGADDFLPIFIFVVLKSNPPYLISNLKYMENFSHPHRLLREEEGYYYTTLLCAVNCIQCFSAKNLNLTPEEYDKYLSSKTVPSSPAAFVTRNNINCLNDLKFRKEKVLDDAKQNANELKQSLSKSVNDIFHLSSVEPVTLLLCHEYETSVEEGVEVDEFYTPVSNIEDVLNEYVIIDEIPEIS